MFKYEIDSLDGIEDAHKAMYEKAGDKFRLKIEGLPQPEDTAGLKSALQKERDRAKIAEQYESLGLKPDEIKKIIAEREEATSKKLEDEGNYQALLDQHKKKAQADLDAANQQREAAVAALQRHVGESAITAELAKAGATKDGINLLPMHLMSRIKVTVANGSPSIDIFGPDGVTPMAGSSASGKATIADLVAEIKQNYPGQFQSDVRGGGGKPPNGGAGSGAKVMARKEFDALTPESKAARMRDGYTVAD